LLTDVPWSLQLSGEHLSLASAALRIRYVRRGVSVSDQDGVTKGEEVGEYQEAGATATGFFPMLETAYPPFARARRHAGWIGFFRWALREGNLRWIDLSALDGVKFKVSRTPDFLCRGMQRERCESAIEVQARR
jgi:hypothetical protein